MPFNRTLITIFLIMTASMLAACGGSSGTGGPAAAPPAPVDPATAITIGNAPLVGSAVMTSVFTIDNLAVLADSLVAGGGPIVNAKSQSSVTAVDTANANCAASGTVVQTVTSDDLDRIRAGILAAGDELSLEFADCDDIGDVDSIVTDGKFTIVVQDFPGNGNTLTGLYRLEADLIIEQLAVTAGGETITLDADMNMVLDLLDAAIVKLTVSGLRVDEQRTPSAAGSAASFTTMTNFEINTSSTISGEDITFTTSGNGVLMSSDFDGEVSFNIDPPFQNRNLDPPQLGTLVITGSSVGEITLNYFDPFQAKLDVTPSDGAPTKPVFTNWEELL